MRHARLSKYAHRGMRISHMMMLTLIAILMPFSKGLHALLEEGQAGQNASGHEQERYEDPDHTPPLRGQAPAHRLFAQARQPRLMRLSGRS